MRRDLRYELNDYAESETERHQLKAETDNIKTVEELEDEMKFYLDLGFQIDYTGNNSVKAFKFCDGPLDIFQYKDDFKIIRKFCGDDD